MDCKNVISAVRESDVLIDSTKSNSNIIFYLQPNINTLAENVKIVHAANKKIFIHIDLAEGIGKDRFGIEFCKKSGVDGIISTRTNIIKAASEVGLYTVQRFFVLDSQSVSTTIESLKQSKADMVEIMPGTVYKIIKKLKGEINIPIIAGGLIETKEEAEMAIKSGAYAISTGKKELWYL